MADTNSFQTEILKQLRSEWITKLHMGQETLKQLRDKLNLLVSQAQELAFKPGQLPVEWSVPETKKLRPKFIMDEMLFDNMVISYIDLKLEECQLRFQRKDPKILAQLYQRMDQTRVTLFTINAEQADLLLKRIKSAISAFVQVRFIFATKQIFYESWFDNHNLGWSG